MAPVVEDDPAEVQGVVAGDLVVADQRANGDKQRLDFLKRLCRKMGALDS